MSENSHVNNGGQNYSDHFHYFVPHFDGAGGEQREATLRGESHKDTTDDDDSPEVNKMKTRFTPLIGAALLFAAMTVWQTPSVFAAEWLRDGFRSPVNEYRPETWFHQCGRNVTKVGITKDLEAVKRAGLRGIHFF